MTATDAFEDPVAIATDPDNIAVNRIVARAASDHDQPFIVEADHGRAATYGEFHDLVRRWATVLRDRGIGPGDRFASFLPSSIDALAIWLAASYLEAFEVPVNPELRGEFLRHVLSDAGARLAVIRPGHEDPITRTGIDIDVLRVPAGESPVDAALPLPVPRSVMPDDVSCVIYTSGTTGPAKGVVITWAQMTANIGRIPRAWLGRDDAVFAPWPMFHVTGRSPLVTMADVGGRVIVRERFSLGDFWSDIRSHRCTSTTIGAVTDLLLAQPAGPDDADNPLRIVLFGRAGRSGVEFLERFGCRGMSFYGSTEVGFPLINPEITNDTRDVIGWQRPGYDARVVGDGAADDVGELWIRPPDRRLILREYLNQPALTSASVVDGWYRTGDAVRRREDGSFVFVDRLKDTIRRFGENISASALESEIVQDPDVLECAAVGISAPVTGQDIHLMVVPVDGVTIEAGELSRRLEERLPRYMHPSRISVLDDLPKTPNGKIRRAGLRELAMDSVAWQAPDRTRPER